jgi:ABC-type lipoprotein release transport system permease subunit
MIIFLLGTIIGVYLGWKHNQEVTKIIDFIKNKLKK